MIQAEKKASVTTVEIVLLSYFPPYNALVISVVSLTIAMKKKEEKKKKKKSRRRKLMII